MNEQTLEHRLEQATREIKALRIAMDRLYIIARLDCGVPSDWAKDALHEMLKTLREEQFVPSPPHLKAVAEMDAQVASDQAFDRSCRQKDLSE